MKINKKEFKKHYWLTVHSNTGQSARSDPWAVVN